MPDCYIPEARLCYVNPPWAWFTTAPLKEQWGDDWDDAPYEYNAGTPYRFDASEAKRGAQPYDLVVVAYDAPFETPAEIANGNSHYSVQDINAGLTAWLNNRELEGRHYTMIFAGETLRAFIQTIADHGGTVYVPRHWCGDEML